LIKSTKKIAIKPTAPVLDMTTTWRSKEPLTKRGAGGGVAGASVTAFWVRGMAALLVR
jgi:hypothetical protein